MVGILVAPIRVMGQARLRFSAPKDYICSHVYVVKPIWTDGNLKLRDASAQLNLQFLVACATGLFIVN
ncbi:MAG: hypothetical protein V9E86_03635 [Nitrosomonas sp.]